MRYVMLALVSLLFVGCVGTMSPTQQADALAVLDSMLATGVITVQQFEVLRDAILAAGTANFWTEVGTVLGGAALAYLGVRLDRGAPERVRAKRGGTVQQAIDVATDMMTSHKQPPHTP